MTDPIKWFISILLGRARTRAIDERVKTGEKKKEGTWNEKKWEWVG